MKLSDVLLILIALFIIGDVLFDWFRNDEYTKEFKNLETKIEKLSKQKVGLDSSRKVTKQQLLDNKKVVDSLLNELEEQDTDTISFNDALDLLNNIGEGK